MCVYECVLVHVSSVVSGSVTPWTRAGQTPLSMEFSRQEHWGVPFSRGSSRPRDQSHVSFVSCTGRWILYQLHPRVCVICFSTCMNRDTQIQPPLLPHGKRELYPDTSCHEFYVSKYFYLFPKSE